MKIFSILFLAFSLMVTPLGEIHAQALTSPTATPSTTISTTTTSTETTALAPAPTLTQGSSSNNTSQEVPYLYPVNELNNPEDAKYLVVSYITAIALAFFGISYSIMCLKSAIVRPSIATFMVASLIYLGGEIYTTFRYKKLASPAKLVDLAKKEETDMQIKSFEEILAKHQDYRDVLKQKFWLTIAAMVAYGLASAIAIVETIYEFAIQDPTKAVGQCIPLKVKAASNDTPKKGLLPLLLLSSSSHPLWLKLILGNDAYALDLPIIGNIGGSDESATPTATSTPTTDTTATATETPSADSGTSVLGVNISDISSYQVIKFLLMGTGGVIGLVAAGLFHAFAASISPMIQKFIASPITRIILFSVAAGIMAILAYWIYNQGKKLDERISYIEEIIKTLREQGANAQNFSLDKDQFSDYIPPVPVAPELRDQVQDDLNNPCLASSKNSVTLDPTCKCKGDNAIVSTCGLSSALDVKTSDIKLPPPIPSIADTISRVGSDISQGNASKALASATDLGKKAMQIKKMYDKMLLKLNDKLKKENRPQLDVKADSNKLYNNFKNSAAKVFSEKKITPAQIKEMGNAIAGGFPESSSPNNLNNINDGSGKDALNKNEMEEKNPPPKNPGGPQNRSLQLGSLPAGNGVDPVASNLATTTDTEKELEKYEENYEDISTKTDTPIFEMISRRYFISGHPRLLEKK